MIQSVVALWKTHFEIYLDLMNKCVEKLPVLGPLHIERKTQLQRLHSRLYDFKVRYTKHFESSCTRPHLELLSDSWAVLLQRTQGSDYWDHHFPRWDFMISQFYVFVIEMEMSELNQQPHQDSEPIVVDGEMSILNQQPHGLENLLCMLQAVPSPSDI